MNLIERSHTIWGICLPPILLYHLHDWVRPLQFHLFLLKNLLHPGLDPEFSVYSKVYICKEITVTVPFKFLSYLLTNFNELNYFGIIIGIKSNNS